MLKKATIFSLVCLFIGTATSKKDELEVYENKLWAKLFSITSECAEKLNVTDEDAERFIGELQTPTYESKCLILCIYRHFNIITAEGKIDKYSMRNFIKPVRAMDKELYNELENVMYMCNKDVVPDPDPCITAANLFQCYGIFGYG